jgi:hypothetical protein
LSMKHDFAYQLNEFVGSKHLRVIMRFISPSVGFFDVTYDVAAISVADRR